MDRGLKRPRRVSTSIGSDQNPLFVLGEQIIITSNYRDLGDPPQVGRRFVSHLLESDRCLASIIQILVAEPGKTGLHDFSLEIDTFELVRRDPCLGNMLLRFPAILLPLLEDSIVEAQRIVWNRLKTLYNANASIFTTPFIKGERNTRIHARLTHLPPNSSHCKPFISALNSKDVGKIIQISGTVVRTGTVQMYESKRAFKCCDKKCGHKFMVSADLEEYNNTINVPTRCPLTECSGTMFEVISQNDTTRSDYQEIKIQESVSNRFSNSKAGRIPKALLVKLQNDLVDKCQPGDDVVVVGSLISHWKSSLPSMSDCEVGTAIVAHSLRVAHGGQFGSSSWERIFDESPQMDNEEDVNTHGGIQSNRRSLVREDILKEFTDFWAQRNHRPIATRNFICKAVCPTLYGLSMIKAALLLTLIGGSTYCVSSESDDILDRTRQLNEKGEEANDYDRPRLFTLAKDESSSELRDHVNFNGTGSMERENNQMNVKKSPSLVQTRRREQSHIFLVGDPGTGKSQFLRFAAALCPRGVMASGSSGTTSAGLTCAAVRESSGKEFTLEAGALVLADKGVAAIDEFNCISKDDRTSIHEALEQQTLSIAKAGIICKLNCRCTVVAVSNPKGGIFDPDRSFLDNAGLGAPLLSRFDLIFKLIDTSDSVKDDNVATFLLNRAIAGSGYECSKKAPDESKEFWSMDKLRAYIATVKSRFHPVVSDVAAHLLQKHYEYCRQLGDCMAIPVTVRYFESLIRLSQAHARLMFRDTVTLDDAVAIILLMECSVYSTSEANFRSNEYFFYKDPMSTVFPEDDEADLAFLHDKFQLLCQYSMKEHISKKEIDLLSKMSMSSAVESHSVEFSTMNTVADDPWNVYNNKGSEQVDHYGRMSQGPSHRGGSY